MGVVNSATWSSSFSLMCWLSNFDRVTYPPPAKVKKTVPSTCPGCRQFNHGYANLFVAKIATCATLKTKMVPLLSIRSGQSTKSTRKKKTIYGKIGSILSILLILKQIFLKIFLF